MRGRIFESHSESHSAPRAEAPAQRPAQTKIDAAQGERIKRIMVPLIAAMNKPRDLKQIKVGVMDDPSINAANAGNGSSSSPPASCRRPMTLSSRRSSRTRLLTRTSGTSPRRKALGAGLNIGMVILDQIIPGSGALTPIAGALVSRAYSRQEEYAADRHGAEILERTGQSKQLMIDTLTWLMQTVGTGQRWLLRDTSWDRGPDRRAQEGERPLSPMDCETLAEGSALEMIAACFRHQHPGSIRGTPVAGPVLPVEVRYGRDDMREPAFTTGDERGSDGAPGGSNPVSEAGWLVVAIVGRRAVRLRVDQARALDRAAGEGAARLPGPMGRLKVLAPSARRVLLGVDDAHRLRDHGGALAPLDLDGHLARDPHAAVLRLLGVDEPLARRMREPAGTGLMKRTLLEP